MTRQNFALITRVLLPALCRVADGCGATPALPHPGAKTLTTNRDTFRVALILPRPRDADAWTRAGYDGLMLIQQELDAQVALSEGKPDAEFERVSL